MRDSKKAVTVTLSFILVLAAGLVLLIEPYMHQDFSQYCDINDRNKLAGTLNTLFIGASHGECAFIPSVFDERTGTNSYNLSNSMMNWFGKEEILKKEISRNKIDTVYLEIAYDSLTRDYKRAEGDIYTIPRIDNLTDRLLYFVKYIKISEYDTVVSTYFSGAMEYYITLLRNGIYKISGKAVEQNIFADIDQPERGYLKKETQREDIALTNDKVKSGYNSESIDVTVNKKSYKKLVEIIDMLKSNNINVIFVVTPLPNSTIFKYKNWDEFCLYLNEIGEKNGCNVFDINLMKNRYSLFDDSSFIDSGHMSYIGAQAFTKSFSDIINKVNSGEDVSDLFYSSYEEMKADSPYMKICNIQS